MQQLASDQRRLLGDRAPWHIGDVAWGLRQHEGREDEWSLRLWVEGGRVGFIVWDARTWETSTYELAGAHAETELGWAILSRHWGHGYATEAALAAREWARQRGQERIVSLIEPRNVRSVRVADKLGAVPEQLVQTDHGPTLVWVHPR